MSTRVRSSGRIASKNSRNVASSCAPQAIPDKSWIASRNAVVVRDRPERGQRHDGAAREAQQPPRAVLRREVAEPGQREDLRQERRRDQPHVRAVREVQRVRADHVGREVGRRDLHADLQREQVPDQAPVPGHARGPAPSRVASGARLAPAGPARSGARAATPTRRARARPRRTAPRTRSSCRPRCSPTCRIAPPASRPEQHRDLGDAACAARRSASACCAGSSVPTQVVQAGAGRHARRPVEGRDQRAARAPTASRAAPRRRAG